VIILASLDDVVNHVEFDTGWKISIVQLSFWITYGNDSDVVMFVTFTNAIKILDVDWYE
jgi:hypothetical protein